MTDPLSSIARSVSQVRRGIELGYRTCHTGCAVSCWHMQVLNVVVPLFEHSFQGTVYQYAAVSADSKFDQHSTTHMAASQQVALRHHYCLSTLRL